MSAAAKSALMCLRGRMGNAKRVLDPRRSFQPVGRYTWSPTTFVDLEMVVLTTLASWQQCAQIAIGKFITAPKGAASMSAYRLR